MMSRLDEFTSLFKRGGGKGVFTNLFREFEEAIQNFLILRNPLDQDEEIAIASFKDQENWSLITTKKIIWTVNSVSEFVEISNIKQIRPAWEQRIQELVGSTENHTVGEGIKIFTFDGKEYLFYIEEGASSTGIWKVLTSVALQ